MEKIVQTKNTDLTDDQNLRLSLDQPVSKLRKKY